MMPSYIEGNKPHDLSQVVEDEEVGSMCVQRIILKDDETILPSMLLSNELWVKYAVDLLGLDKIRTSPTGVTSFDKQKADNLLKKTEGRYSSHVKTRVNDISKCNH
jgi:hypothetical protein